MVASQMHGTPSMEDVIKYLLDQQTVMAKKIAEPQQLLNQQMLA